MTSRPRELPGALHAATRPPRNLQQRAPAAHTAATALPRWNHVRWTCAHLGSATVDRRPRPRPAPPSLPYRQMYANGQLPQNRVDLNKLKVG